MRTEFITSIVEFKAMREEWTNLLENSVESNPFLSHQWLQTWWEVYGHGTLNIVAVRSHEFNKLVGLLPLFRFRTKGLVSITVLRFLGSERVSSDFLGCLAYRGLEKDVYHACLKSLCQDDKHWDIIQLQDIDEASQFFRFLVNAGGRGVEIIMDPGKCCPFLNLSKSWEVFLGGLSTKMRQRVGYYRRALERKGAVSLERVTHQGILQDALFDMVRLRNDRMDQKGLKTAQVSEDYLRFHSDLLPRFLDCDRFRLYFLCLDGQRIAYLYLFAGSDRIYFYQTGFDRAWSKQSVGFVLLGMVIEKSIQDGYTVFEFLRGNEHYKYEWGNVEQRFLGDVSIFSRKPSGVICQLLSKIVNKLRVYKRLILAKVIMRLKNCFELLLIC